NIRELENVVRRLAALCPHDVITAEIIAAELDTGAAEIVTPMAAPSGVMPDAGLSEFVEAYLARYFNAFGGELPPVGLYDRILEEIEAPLISAALAATRGNQIRAADLLGLNRNTLRKKIKDLDIRVLKALR
ncbi:MAG: helix-turn-helix domain-containing protein, partial [Beijerinckiaceae bacterium]